MALRDKISFTSTNTTIKTIHFPSLYRIVVIERFFLMFDDANNRIIL